MNQALYRAYWLVSGGWKRFSFRSFSISSSLKPLAFLITRISAPAFRKAKIISRFLLISLTPYTYSCLPRFYKLVPVHQIDKPTDGASGHFPSESEHVIASSGIRNLVLPDILSGSAHRTGDALFHFLPEFFNLFLA